MNVSISHCTIISYDILGGEVEVEWLMYACMAQIVLDDRWGRGILVHCTQARI